MNQSETMKNYSVISENTIDFLSLHDCQCSHFYYDKEKLVLEMEWMEVLATHPENPFEKAHQSGEGRIELFSPKIIEGQLHLAMKEGCPPITRNIAIDDMDFRDVEVLVCEEEKVQNGFQSKWFFRFDWDHAQYDSIALRICYEKSKVMWNELNEVSWFE